MVAGLGMTSVVATCTGSMVCPLHWTRSRRSWDDFSGARHCSSVTLHVHSIQDGLHYAGHVLGCQGVDGWLLSRRVVNKKGLGKRL